MRFLLLDSVLSAIFNIIAVSCFLLLYWIKSLKELEVVLLFVLLLMLFANLFTFKILKAKYVEFKANESKPRTGKFSSSCDLKENKKELNALQNLYGTRPTEVNIPIVNNYESQPVDYAEVKQAYEAEIYEHIDSYTENDIYSNVDAYDTIHKPESEQYDKVNFL